MLANLKIDLGITGTEQDTLLERLLDKAESKVLDYCRLTELPNDLEEVVIDLAIIIYNRRGTEGETSRSEGGISSSFDEIINNEFKGRLSGYVQAKVVGEEELES